MIKIKWATWKTRNEDDFLSKYDITTIVLKQKGIYIDPSDSDFIDAIFKEYVRKFLKKKKIVFKLSKIELFFYAENSNIYFLNYIYNDFFPNKEKNPFNSLIKTDEGTINLSLFNGFDEQVLFLVEILEKMEINFKKLTKKYSMLVEFPHSLECYDEDRVYKVRYSKWKKRC